MRRHIVSPWTRDGSDGYPVRAGHHGRLALALLGVASAAVFAQAKVESFDLGRVRLLPGPFREAQGLDER